MFSTLLESKARVSLLLQFLWPLSTPLSPVLSQVSRDSWGGGATREMFDILSASSESSGYITLSVILCSRSSEQKCTRRLQHQHHQWYSNKRNQVLNTETRIHIFIFNDKKVNYQLIFTQCYHSIESWDGSWVFRLTPAALKARFPVFFLTICKYQMPSKQQIKLFEFWRINQVI